MAQVSMPVCAGDKLRIQAKVSVTTPSATYQHVSVRVREYNHRPGTANPWTTFVFGHDSNHLLESRSVNVYTPEQVAHFSIEAHVNVIATTPDALFVLEVWTDNGNILVSKAELGVERA